MVSENFTVDIHGACYTAHPHIAFRPESFPVRNWVPKCILVQQEQSSKMRARVSFMELGHIRRVFGGGTHETKDLMSTSIFPSIGGSAIIQNMWQGHQAGIWD